LRLVVCAFVWLASNYHTSFLANYVLTGNSAYFEVGGLNDGALSGCVLLSNGEYGDGSASATLESCTVVINSAASGGFDANGLTHGTNNVDVHTRIFGRMVEMDVVESKNASCPCTTWLISEDKPGADPWDSFDLGRDGINNWQEWLCGTRKFPPPAQGLQPQGASARCRLSD
jgi:hypothetical protein